MGKIIGIDLGTTYSAVAWHNGKTAEIIPDRQGRRTMPSIVTFTDTGAAVGEEARQLEFTWPETTIKRIKRRMGTDASITAGGKTYSPEEISAMILKKLKDQAEEHLGERVTDAIITVPAYFNDNQRQATRSAGKLAGLNVLRIINEPTAASLAYGVNPEQEMNIVVYDLGGGTFDVSVLTVADGIYEVVATAGDNSLGGEDFNKRLTDLTLSRFQDETGLSLAGDPLALAQVTAAVEKAKIELSASDKATIHVPFVTADENGARDLNYELTRAEFESLIGDYIERSLELTRQALADAHLEAAHVSRVILVGGSSRIPLVRNKLTSMFGRAVDAGINPDEVVARGAALQGSIIGGDLSGIVLVDVNPISLGIEVENGYFVPIIERNTPIPTAARRVFTTVADSQKSVDVHIMQGESMYSKNNISLGRFRLEGIRGALKGEARIEVSFEMDVNGCLHVSAIDADTRSAQGITIVEQGRMPEEEMVRLMEEHAQAYQDEIRKRSLLENVLKVKTRAENTASRLLSRVAPAYRQSLLSGEITELLNTAQKALDDLNISVMQRILDRLEFMESELSAGTYRYEEMIA